MGLTIPEHERAQFEDLLGSGSIFRRLVTRTDGEQAEFGEQVTVRYTARVLETNALVDEDRVCEFRIGDGEVMPALELSAKMMRVGEAQEVRCDARFAYGEKGRAPHVPPNAAMVLFLELLKVGKRLTAEMDAKELLVEATKKKESGNRFFQEENYEQAAKMYKKALKILEMWERDDNADDADDENAKQCKELLVALGNNVANVQHRLKQYKEAKQSSLEVLQLDPNNVKALYRAAQISLDDNEFQDAADFAKRGLAIDAKNTKLRDLLTKLKQKKEAHKAKEKQLYAKLGGTTATTPSTDAEGTVQQLSPTRQFIRTNISTISTVATALIGMLIYVFIGKRFHGME